MRQEGAMAGRMWSWDSPERWLEGLLVVAALGLAVLSARPYAGGWNDGSRLATVEALIDQHTWIIDHSIFVQVPRSDSTTPLPYSGADPALLAHGTYDKLLINGHYYSDKSPVPALYLAGCYQVWQWLTGWTAHQRPDRFCLLLTILSSGLAYVVGVVCIYRLGRKVGLSLGTRLALALSFALATVALPYVQHVNNHILLLAVTAVLTLHVAHLLQDAHDRPAPWRLVSLGTLAGLGYTIDLGTGPVFLLSTGLFLLAHCRSELGFVDPRRWLAPGLLFAAAALPWLVLHHVLNYLIGGSFTPANAHAEYFLWPDSPFDADNLTGGLAHRDPLSFVLYALSMIDGKRGFFGHNLPLFVLFPALLFFRHSSESRTERLGVLWALGCCVGTWLLYAATSNNSSGRCCSIRWFLPLLAPSYYLLAFFLRRRPSFTADFLIWSGWGVLLVGMIREGPWMQHMVPFYWPLQGAALGSWGIYRFVCGQLATPVPALPLFSSESSSLLWRMRLWRGQRLPISSPPLSSDNPVVVRG
jgi:hypothetical protein